VKESDSDYFKKLFVHLPGWTEDNDEDYQPEWSVSGPGFEPLDLSI
jgi:hypothetical protein